MGVWWGWGVGEGEDKNEGNEELGVGESALLRWDEVLVLDVRSETNIRLRPSEESLFQGSCFVEVV